MLNATWATVVNAWHRLWSVGANGDTIRNRTNSQTNQNQNTTNSNTTNQRTYRNNITTHNPPSSSATLSQTDLHGNDIDTLDGEEYGDIMEPKKESTLRLMLHNVNCLSANSQDTKSRKLIQTIAHKQIDVAMLTEIGLYWPLVPTKDKWYERTRLSFQSSRSILACNSTEPDRTRINQYGGVAVIAVDDVSHRVVGQGQDSTGLGRWAWMLFEGKQGHKLRVISVYRPVESIGPSTVFTQHE